MKVASNFILFITMREQNRHNRLNWNTAINTVSQSQSEQNKQIYNKEYQKRKYKIIPHALLLIYVLQHSEAA